MEKHLKKRIVGAVVTVMVVAITLPAVIDSSRKKLTLEDDLPPMPPMPEWAEVENQKRIRIDLEKLASGDARKHLTPPPMDTSPADDPVPQKQTIPAPVPVSKPVAVEKSLAKTAVAPSKDADRSSPKPATDMANKGVVDKGIADKGKVSEPKQPDLSNVPALDDANLPYAWVVQLGAFANEKNARELRDTLRKKGIKSYTNTQIDGLTRVYAGPELKRAAAESLRQKLVLLLDNDNLPIKRYRAR